MNRISLKIGMLEIEYEGDQDFIENRLVALVQELTVLSPLSKSRGLQEMGASLQDSPMDTTSTNTIAQIIDARTGSDLVLAAIVRITIVRKQPSAIRHQILSEMKEATTYYRDTYASNLSSYLDSLVKSKRVNLVSKSNYALPAVERNRFEGLLTDGDK